MINVFFSDKLTVDQGDQGFGPRVVKSPSAMKPKLVAEAVKGIDGVIFTEPRPVDWEDFKLAHDPAYVDGIKNLTIENGFGNISQAVNDTLPYTTGAMYDAALAATVDTPCCALVSGFHHAGYKGWRGLGYFCTFNGLVVAARKLKERVMIIDCDMHFGNGTENCLKAIEKANGDCDVLHYSFGKHFFNPSDADDYLNMLLPGSPVHGALKDCGVKKIIYQSGADVHIDDSYGGVLTVGQMYERDRRMFLMARDLGIPIAWNLAGGYQSPVEKVIDLHVQTFMACKEIYGL